jgi:hypothetical protein
MAWSDVASRIKFFGPDADDLGNPTGLDGMPMTVNGVTPYGESCEVLCARRLPWRGRAPSINRTDSPEEILRL